MQSCNPNSTPNLAVVSVSRRKSFWKMVRSMLIPRKLLGPLAACGGLKEKRRRRVERLKRGKSVPLERPRRFISRSGSVDSAPPSIPHPPPPTEVTPPPLISNDLLDQCFHRLSMSSSHTEFHASSRTDLHPESIINEYEQGGLNVVSVIIHPNGNASSTLRTSESESNSGDGESNRNSQQSSRRESESTENTEHPVEASVILRNKRNAFSNEAFDGWRKSSVEVCSDPPITLKYIPSGLQVGDKVMWIADSEPQPERADVKWIGKIRGEYYAGIEFGRKIGNSSGLYGYGLGLFHRLFTCELGYGRFVPVSQLVLSSDFHDKGSKAGFICVICRDDFLELCDVVDAEDESLNMVATKCGHLYHAQCLKLWFDKTLKQNAANGSSSVNDRCRRCPHCQAEIKDHEIIKLFPAQV